MRFLERLKNERILFDGAMGTMLQAAGVESGDCPELLNMSRPDVVENVHRQYAAAGAQAVETNSLGLNAPSLSRHGLEDRLEELTEAAVRCALRGAGEGVYVALSVGPTGDMLRPLGALSPEAAYEGYRRQVVAGERAGADLIYIETVSDAAEARLAVLAAKEHTSLPIVCSFTYEVNGRTLMGGTPVSVAAIVRAAGADVIATNCSGGPDQLLGILKETRSGSDIPMIVQPNAGLPTVQGGKVSYPLGPEAMAEAMQPILRAGACAIGGCCGTTPEHIVAMREMMRPLRLPPQEMPPPAPTLYAPRASVTLAAAREGLCELPGELDALYDADSSAAALLLDIRALSPAQIAELLEEASSIVRAPLCFLTSDDKQAEAALRAYAGVAAVSGGVSDAILQKYGAMRL